MIKIAIDAMGGDHAPKEIVLGTLEALNQFKDIEVLLYGDEAQITQWTDGHERLKIIHTDKYLSMDEEDPVKAFRQNREASMFLAMKAVKDQAAEAVVSAGPTQGLVIGGHFVLKRISGMKRIALTPILPSFDGCVRILLDAGANVDLKPQHLLDFAIGANIIATNYLKINHPKVGLLNIGSEEGKGRQIDIETYNLLKENSQINFIGNIEPKEVFNSEVDIILADGFTGNIFLKSLEGMATAFMNAIKNEVQSSFKNKMGALLMKKAFKKIKNTSDPANVGGAILLGVDGLLIKAHGSSNRVAFFNAIRQAREMVKAEVMPLIKASLERSDDDE